VGQGGGGHAAKLFGNAAMLKAPQGGEGARSQGLKDLMDYHSALDNKDMAL
jgi:hypothetical protein